MNEGDREDLGAEASREKRRVALTSVGAAVVLTGTKLVVGLMTGSLGLLSEAAHSGLDLFAAAMTYFAVRISDRPADADHRYGHGKVENLSAFVETLLLLATCAWIVKEATERLFFKPVEVHVTFWSFVVVIGSILIDVSRSRALLRVARKYRSQALEADALHFSTDVWSSCVVLVGLVLVSVGEMTGRQEAFSQADALAAMGVAALAAFVSFRLGKRTVDALLDRVPADLAARIESQVRGVPGVLGCGRVRLRESGHRTFVDLEIDVDRAAPFERSHDVSVAVEETIRALLPSADVIVHVNPARVGHENVIDRVRTIAANQGQTVHNVLLYEADGRLGLELHMEVDEAMDLGTAHDRTEALESAIRAEMPHISTITTRIESRGTRPLSAEDITLESRRIVERVRRIVAEIPQVIACHDVTVRRSGDDVAVSMHCTFDPSLSVAEVHRVSMDLERRLRRSSRGLSRITIHAEPVAEGREPASTGGGEPA